LPYSSTAHYDVALSGVEAGTLGTVSNCLWIGYGADPDFYLCNGTLIESCCDENLNANKSDPNDAGGLIAVIVP